MNLELGYLLYLGISIAMTIWVARTLSKNGEVFLVKCFGQDQQLAKSTNHLLVVGFYLVNIGFIALRMDGWNEAKAECRDRTGGLALTVVRRILLEWALAPRVRRRRRRYRPTVDPFFVDRPSARYSRFTPPLTIDPVDFADYERYADVYDNEGFDPVDQVRYVRVRPPYRNGWRRRRNDLNGSLGAEAGLETSLPEYLI